MIILGLAVLYRYGPSRREPRWQWISVGSVVAAVAWLISSALLSWYLANFAHYDATYGSLGAGIGMMMWMWISSIVILFSAQLNSEIEHQTVRDFDRSWRQAPRRTRRRHGRYSWKRRNIVSSFADMQSRDWPAPAWDVQSFWNKSPKS